MFFKKLKMFFKLKGNSENAGESDENHSSEVQGLFEKHKSLFLELRNLEGFLGNTSKYLLENTSDQQRIVDEIRQNYDVSQRLIREFEGNLNKLKNYSQISDRLAKEGAESLNTLQETFTSIHEIKDQLNHLNAISEGINAKLAGISTIVDMSKFLSLNISIEAAHLGVQGGSIAVVAKEMIKLSENIRGTSNDITVILKSNVEKIDHLTGFVETKLESSSQSVGQVSNKFNEIIENIFMLSSQMNELASSVEIYNQSNKTLSETLNQMTKTTSNLGTASANCKLVQVNANEFLEIIEDQSVSDRQVDAFQMTGDSEQSIDSGEHSENKKAA